ncbi:GILT-like protein 1 [Bombyx mori]|uniref:Uncharacterized protein n=1 Tax=Bombyx mori TaxID=7091 RepID=A0A8R1WJC2_BOMMO|nr:GILT-like protein 1 [Bombyx mori]
MSAIHIYLVIFCVINFTTGRHKLTLHRGHAITEHKAIADRNISLIQTRENNRLNGEGIRKSKEKVSITVYYETLCPASIRLFVRQLKPAVEKLSSHLDVQLVPYGFALTYNIGGYYMFTCQHGPDECYGNKMHACVVDTLRNSTKAVLFNTCLMQYSVRDRYGFNLLSVIHWCGYKLKVLVSRILDCVNSKRGSVILKNYGDQTQMLMLKYVPYILIDNSAEKQNDAMVNLISTVCKILVPTPQVCNKTVTRYH